MIRLFANAAYDFIRWRRWAYALTAALIIPGFALFLVHGLNYSIEFTGGTLIQVQTPQPVGAATLRGALDAAGIRDAEIQEFGDPLDYVVRARLRPTGGLAEGSTEATAAAVDSALAHALGAAPHHHLRPGARESAQVPAPEPVRDPQPLDQRDAAALGAHPRDDDGYDRRAGAAGG